MVSGKFIIKDPKGLHLRPASVLSKEALEFKCSVHLIVGNFTGDAKSVLGVLAAGIKSGTEIEIQCSGEDENEALQRIGALIENELNES